MYECLGGRGGNEPIRHCELKSRRQCDRDTTIMQRTLPEIPVAQRAWEWRNVRSALGECIQPLCLPSAMTAAPPPAH